MKKPTLRKRRKPTEMVLYFCPHCKLESGRTDIDAPFCYYCERSDGLVELERKPLSPEAIANRMKQCANRMMENLRKAYDIKKADWPNNPEEELQLLEALAEGKNFEQSIEKFAGKTRKR